MDSVKRWADTRHAKAVDPERVAELGKKMLAEARGYRLAEARKRRDLTQVQVAEAMRITPGRVSQIERGLVTDIGVDVVARYIAALGGRMEIVADFGDERLAVG